MQQLWTSVFYNSPGPKNRLILATDTFLLNANHLIK